MSDDRTFLLEEDIRVCKATVGSIQQDVAVMAATIDHMDKMAGREYESLGEKVSSVAAGLSAAQASLSALSERVARLERAPADEALEEVRRMRRERVQEEADLRKGVKAQVLNALVGAALVAAGFAASTAWNSLTTKEAPRAPSPPAPAAGP